MDLLETIRNRRKELNLKQSDLAELSGVSKIMISMIETGKKQPTLRTLQKVLEVLGMEIIIRPIQKV